MKILKKLNSQYKIPSNRHFIHLIKPFQTPVKNTRKGIREPSFSIIAIRVFTYINSFKKAVMPKKFAIKRKKPHPKIPLRSGCRSRYDGRTDGETGSGLHLVEIFKIFKIFFFAFSASTHFKTRIFHIFGISKFFWYKGPPLCFFFKFSNFPKI